MTQTASGADAETRFARLSALWHAETDVLSSSTKKNAHPALREVVSMGPSALAPILREMGERPGHWFAALREISGEDPVRDARVMPGDVLGMTEAWLAWGRRKGYVTA